MKKEIDDVLEDIAASCSYTPFVPPKITPIRPVEEKRPFDDPEWLFELKA